MGSYSCRNDALGGYTSLGNNLALCGASPNYAKVLTSQALPNLNQVAAQGSGIVFPWYYRLYRVQGGNVIQNLGNWQDVIANGPAGSSLSSIGVLPPNTKAWTGVSGNGAFASSCGYAWDSTSGGGACGQLADNWGWGIRVCPRCMYKSKLCVVCLLDADGVKYNSINLFRFLTVKYSINSLFIFFVALSLLYNYP